MLYLLARHDADSYAVEADRVRRVLPFARLKAVPSDLPALAGLLNFEGRPVPVVDLGLLVSERGSRPLLTTRIAVMDAFPGGDGRLLGLLAEDMTRVESLDDDAFTEPGIHPAGRDWLGPVCDCGGRLVQRIRVEELLPADLIDALTAEAAEMP